MEKKLKTKSKQWFLDRIGKRIYRDEGDCECVHCKDIEENGFIISDANHALYVYDAQNDMASEGGFLNYRDEK